MANLPPLSPLLSPLPSPPLSPLNPRVVPILSRGKTTQSPACTRTTLQDESTPEKTTKLSQDPGMSSLELECLDYFQLYAKPVVGDGNCLFYSISDQLYGDFEQYAEIRQRLVDQMRKSSAYFEEFSTDAGGERRAPKRDASEAARQKFTGIGRPATKRGQKAAFHSELRRMAGNSYWGGALELQAFCQSYGMDVLVYSVGGVQRFKDYFSPDDPDREVIHLGYHNSKHFFSVRESERAPTLGLPNLPDQLKGADRIYCESKSKESAREKAVEPNNETCSQARNPAHAAAAAANGISEQEPIQSPKPDHADMHWMITIFGHPMAAKDESIRTLVGKYGPNITGALNTLLANRSKIRSNTSTSTSNSNSNSPLPSCSSSANSVTSKRSADASELDEEEHPAPSASVIRRYRGGSRKRRMLGGVAFEIQGSRDEVLAIANGANGAVRRDVGGHVVGFKLKARASSAQALDNMAAANGSGGGNFNGAMQADARHQYENPNFKQVEDSGDGEEDEQAVDKDNDDGNDEDDGDDEGDEDDESDGDDEDSDNDSSSDFSAEDYDDDDD
ncbi:hypothetical protein PAAG_02363 [Paracoccidioides lutzii Pb01]|uniref:OTU domain-containing protein n=1 Tax=Paracoccidioides lutzii (strain ATCC MYA-826 / Pb01) TaxID=502779 RepID=C1GUP0_PARBA|nr:hypothetical protein PAAG_02363 [Paracoccidioides lutzii Pb01]EEH40308.2 hypothetical protein PAAG_02363 [Paracoccidioides lutzii Pb01]